MLSLTACSKQIECPEDTPYTSVQPKDTENYNVPDSLIIQVDWKIVGRYDYDNASIRIWKLQAIQSGDLLNYFLLIDPPDTHYWKPGYQLGDILDGIDVVNFKRR